MKDDKAQVEEKSMSIQLLDCTLRDGAYIVDGNFGDRAIYGIIKRLSEANIGG